MLSFLRSIPSRIATALVGYVLVILVAGAWGGTALANAGEGSEDSFPLACAARDLDLVTLIELRGESEVIAPSRLADAYLTLLQARKLCSDGNVPEALVIYRHTFTLLFEEGHRQQGRVADH